MELLTYRDIFISIDYLKNSFYKLKLLQGKNLNGAMWQNKLIITMMIAVFGK
jgi:hypothetical protein